MTIEEEIFKRKKINIEKLEVYGFTKQDDNYHFQTTIMDGDFRVEVLIDCHHKVHGKVIDLDLEEEYTAYRVITVRGNFAGQVLDCYSSVLEDIAKHCCDNLLFVSEQANRISERLVDTVSDFPQFPFEKHPNIAAYRYEPNNKWYALIMPVKKGKLDSQHHPFSKDEIEDEVEVVDLKVPPAKVEELVALDGIFPAYHMNKKHWITVTLDDKVTDDFLFDLVQQSRQLVIGNAAALKSDYWIIPANPKYYDIDKEFSENNVIKWTQKASMKAGDFVFIYITNPVKAMRYACRVLEADLDNNGYREESSIKKLMQLERIATFPDDAYPIAKLKEYGVSTIRGPRRLPEKLVKDLIEKKEIEED